MYKNVSDIKSDFKQLLIDKNFVIDKSYEGFDAWAKRFIPKKMFRPKVSIQKFKPYNKIYYGNKIKAWIEKFDITIDDYRNNRQPVVIEFKQDEVLEEDASFDISSFDVFNG